jgi:ABC-type nitrate/sulfonate/bicarbonate transport system substrate-binding protein
VTETIKLIAFPGAPNLPIFVAQEKGWFAKHDVALDMKLTPNSAYQAEALAKGEFDIAGTAFDNVVAYTEGQGAIAFDTPPDFFAFLGATQIELAIVARPEFKSDADLAGKSLALDAPGTGFAFVLYHMLEKGGVKPRDYERVAVGATPTRWESVRDGKHAATMTIEPFTSIAKAQGFNIVARSTQSLADYQGGVFASRRSWAAKNPAAVKGFIKAYLDGLAWTLDPANREEAAQILLRNMPDIKPGVVGSVMASLLSSASGLTPKGAVTIPGIMSVLDLRTRYGKPGAALTDPHKYIDLSYYDAAVREMA